MELRQTAHAFQRALASTTTPRVHTQCLRQWHALPSATRSFTTSRSLLEPPRQSSGPAHPPRRSALINPNASTSTPAPEAPEFFNLAGSANRSDPKRAQAGFDLIADVMKGREEFDSNYTNLPTARVVAEAEQSKLRPELGRTIQVQGSVDIGRAFNMLEVLVARNKVKQDQFSQKFHERPGMKRKRLKSARWKSRFKDAFSDRANRVLELAKQGW